VEENSAIWYEFFPHLEVVGTRILHPLDDLFQGRSHVRVLRALGDMPEGFEASTREVARRAGVSHPTASAVLDALREQGVVTVRRTPRADEYRVNPLHVLWEQVAPLLRWERRVGDEASAFIADRLAELAPWVSAAYLFGSSVRGDADPGSDLDVGVICPQARVSDTEDAMEEIGERTAERFGNRVSAIVGSRPIEELSRGGRPGSRLWKAIAEEGIPLIAAGAVLT
jgi:predicted nucleotidyltransferase